MPGKTGKKINTKPREVTGMPVEAGKRNARSKVSFVYKPL